VHFIENKSVLSISRLRHGISFKKNFLVLPFGSEKYTTKAWILEGGNRLNFEALFFEFDGFGCAITTTEV
jgi:hypothetical protein